MTFDNSTPGRILGIGGIFFKSPDEKALQSWYSEKLGLPLSPYGTFFHWRADDNPENRRMTIWSVFPDTTKYLEPGKASFMVNYIIDDLDAFLTKCEAGGVTIDAKRQNESYGRFAWIYDPDGNKIELWQPLGGQ